MANLFRIAVAATMASVVFCCTRQAKCDIVTPVTGWAVHNGTSSVADGGTNSPTFATADNISVMGAFSDVTLANDGDFAKLTLTLNLATRTGNTGTNNLNTQLRVGLFNGPAGAVVANDIPNKGFIFEYTNEAPAVAANRRLIRAQTSADQTNPFTSPTNIGNGTADDGNDSIQGADIGPVEFEVTLTRNAALIDLTGKMVGTDSVSGNDYIGLYSRPGYDSVANGIGFVFNRAAFFFGPNVDGTNGGTLSNVLVTSGNIYTIPESRFGMLAVALLMGTSCTAWKLRSKWARRHGD